MPIAWLSHFLCACRSRSFAKCQASCHFALPMDTIARLSWLLLPHKALPLGFTFATDAIAVGCLSMPFTLIVGRSHLLCKVPFVSCRIHFSVVLAPFLFWMQRSSVVGRLYVCLPAVAIIVVNGAAVVRTDCIVRYATSRRMLFYLVFFESRCRSHLFFQCEFSVMLRCPKCIL